ncbi:MAG: glycosyltransferase family 4 protein [Deltaproteobacteria bacterium]|nr:glycosyltransferase family 4 protein [Deltaproteobacteria bacterium]
MRLLHVFAGPFPTAQGTQVLVGQICRLLARAGHDVHLLSYAHLKGEAHEPFEIHRIPDRPSFSSERSGPAWQKPVLDLSLALRARSLARSLRPHIVHAHHCEALAAARLADPGSRTPLVFHAHALLGPELATYLDPRLEAPAALAGGLIDRFLPRFADRVAAVSDFVADACAAAGVPRSCIEVVRPHAELPGIPRDVEARAPGRLRAIYAGNLDRYQGVEELCRGLSLLDRASRDLLEILFVTDSKSDGLVSLLRRLGLEDFASVRPHGEPARALGLMASADIALVPRLLPGGAPIKLVNALALGLPVIVDRAVAEGLEHGREAFLVHMRDPAEVASAVAVLAHDARLRERLSAGALAAARRLHDPATVLATLERIYSHSAFGI